MDLEGTIRFLVCCGEWDLLFGSSSGFWGFFESGIDGVARVVDFLACEQFLDAQDLEARVLVDLRAGDSWRVVETSDCGFFLHWLCWLLHGEERADFGFLAFDDAAEVADVRGLDVSGFDGEDDLLAFASGGENERRVILER